VTAVTGEVDAARSPWFQPDARDRRARARHLDPRERDGGRGRRGHPGAGAGGPGGGARPGADRGAERGHRRLRAFEITLLPPGTYSLSVTRDGFFAFNPEALVLKGGKMRVRIAVLAIPPPITATSIAVEFNDSMTAPAMVSGPAPEYTPEAIERGVEGSMQVRCVVTVEGRSGNARS